MLLKEDAVAVPAIRHFLGQGKKKRKKNRETRDKQNKATKKCETACPVTDRLFFFSRCFK